MRNTPCTQEEGQATNATHCGKFGHKSADCYSKGKGKHNSVLDGNKHHDKNLDKKGRKPMTGKCYNCGVVGHPAFLCPKKKKGKKGDDTDMANAATDGADDEEDEYEVCLLAMDEGEWDDESVDSDDDTISPLVGGARVLVSVLAI